MTDEIRIRNAKITDAEILIEDHGFLTAYITLDYGGSGQGFGGYTLHSENQSGEPNFAGHFLRRTLEIVGVQNWSDLTGKCIRVMSRHNGVKAIGHILEDRWFDPSDEFESLRVKS